MSINLKIQAPTSNSIRVSNQIKNAYENKAYQKSAPKI